MEWPSCTYTIGEGINDSGQVVGYGIVVNGNTQTDQAFIGTISGSTAIPLPNGWSGAIGYSINNSGQVAGFGYNGTTTQAFIGTASGSTPIPLPTGWSSVDVHGINNSGQVVGGASTGTASQAFFGTASGSTPIPLPTGWSSAEGYGINDLGQVVGVQSFNGGGFIWDPTNGARDLNTLVPSGWTITAAYGINNAGQIVGYGSNSSTGFRGVVVLTPSSITITTMSLPTATSGMPYTATLSATGGTPPYKWLPPSITPGAVSGKALTGFMITGSPAAPPATASLVSYGASPPGTAALPDTYQVTLNVADSNGVSATPVTLPLVVNKGVVHISLELGTDFPTKTDPNMAMLALASATDYLGNALDMQDAARELGFDHFNWIQKILSDSEIAACAADMSLPDCLLSGLNTYMGTYPPVPTWDPAYGGYAYQWWNTVNALVGDTLGIVCPNSTVPTCVFNQPIQDFWPMYYDEYFGTGQTVTIGDMDFTPFLAGIQPDYLDFYTPENHLTPMIDYTVVAPAQALGYLFSDRPDTFATLVPGTTNTELAVRFETTLVGVSDGCNTLGPSSNCTFALISDKTNNISFQWQAAQGFVRNQQVTTQNFGFPIVNPVDLTGPQLANSLISVNQFLTLAGLTPQSLAAIGGSIASVPASLIPSEAAALVTATTVIPALASGNACNGTFTGTFTGNLSVSSGQACIVSGGTITGNVTVTGGNLELNGAAVDGNVQVQGGGTVTILPSAVIGGSLLIQNLPGTTSGNQVCGAEITGNLQFQNNAVGIAIGGAPLCPNTTINGNLQITNNSAPTTVSNTTVRGDLQDQSNTAPTEVVGNTVGGNLQVQNNGSAAQITENVVGNTVGKNLQVQNNTVPSQVSNNVVTGNLQCQNNATISGSGNTVAGQKQGQCATF